MKKVVLFILVHLISYQWLVAQRSKISYIADAYLAVKEQISNKELEHSTFRLNMGNHSWNTTLGYKRTETYYYSINSNQEGMLKFLVVNVDSTTNQYHIEYLFNKEGKIIYCLEKQQRPKYHYRELKTYFEEDKLIQLSEDNVIIQSSTIFHSQKVKYLRESARYYWQKFQDYINFSKK